MAEVPADTKALRDALHAVVDGDDVALTRFLVRILARLVDGRTVTEIHGAFGAPGDFGYDTPIGDALAKLYRGGR